MTFKDEFEKVQRMLKDDPDNSIYWLGYLCGLYKAYYGERFTKSDGYRKFLSEFNRNESKKLKRGARDGVAALQEEDEEK